MNAQEQLVKPARSFEDLIMWQKSHQFVLEVYKLSSNFPKTETFGITSQIRRAAVSIPANIAEGFKKASRQDKARFMNIAQGSLEECRYYLILVQDLKFGDTTRLKLKVSEISKILDSYCKSLLAHAG